MAVVEEEVVGEVAEEEVAEEVAEETMATGMMTITTTTYILTDQVHPVADGDGGFSTIKKWNSNWLKSCKISDRWLRGDESLVSRPPIPSQPLIKMDDVPP